MISILLLMDNSKSADQLISFFEKNTVICDYAQSYQTAKHLLEENHYQALIIDLESSQLCIFKTCTKIRDNGFDLPIILLNSPRFSKEVLRAFYCGADDYLEKPFLREELLVRTIAISKRGSGQNKFLCMGKLKLNLTNKQLMCGTQLIKISPINFKLLEVLMRSSPNPVSRQHMIQRIWGDNHPETSSSLRVHIFLLRKVLSKECPNHFIHTVPGYGFALSQEGSEHKKN